MALAPGGAHQETLERDFCFGRRPVSRQHVGEVVGDQVVLVVVGNPGKTVAAVEVEKSPAQRARWKIAQGLHLPATGSPRDLT